MAYIHINRATFKQRENYELSLKNTPKEFLNLSNKVNIGSLQKVLLYNNPEENQWLHFDIYK